MSRKTREGSPQIVGDVPKMWMRVPGHDSLLGLFGGSLEVLYFDDSTDLFTSMMEPNCMIVQTSLPRFSHLSWPQEIRCNQYNVLSLVPVYLSTYESN